MEPKQKHRVLIVDDEAKVAKAIGRILEMEDIETVSAESGEKGLDAIRNAATPFSLIISDQRMPGMEGTQFLEQAKQIAPDAIRFLITGYSQMQTIIHAVNKGAVQRYISKPWDHDELLNSVLDGINLYEQLQENEKLIGLAKRQNKQLYDLNCELMELTTGHNNKLKTLDLDIKALKEKKLPPQEKASGDPAVLSEKLAKIILDSLGDAPDQQGLDGLFSDTLEALFLEFNDLAQRNGFELDLSLLESNAPREKDAGPVDDPGKTNKGEEQTTKAKGSLEHE